MIDIRKWGFATCLSLLLLAGPVRAAPEVGWWWNPNESGRGFFVESLNGIMYLAGYFYEPDGRATWLVSGGPNTDSYNYQGRLLSYRNGQTIGGEYKPPSTPTDAGPVSISFSDDTHGTIVWPGGTIPIVRQVFGAEPSDFQPDSGWWWNDAESGRGYSIEVQGDKLFAVAFMYDAAGNPVWYYSAGTMTSPTTYAGPWLQFAGGQTLTGPYRPPGAPVVVGQLGIEFTAPDQATLTIADASAAHESPLDLRKQFKEIKIKRQFVKPKAPLPNRWTLQFEIESEYVNIKEPTTTTVGQTQILKWKWIATEVELAVDDKINGSYRPTRGFVVITPYFFQVRSDNKEMCESKPGQKFSETLRGDAIKLDFAHDSREARGSIDIPDRDVLIMLDCVEGSRRFDNQITLKNGILIALTPKPLDSGIYAGRITNNVEPIFDDGIRSSKRTTSLSWSFVPVK